jgi:hypothetical protein
VGGVEVDWVHWIELRHQCLNSLLARSRHANRKVFMLKHIQTRQSRQCREAWTYACHLSVEVIIMLADCGR